MVKRIFMKSLKEKLQRKIKTERITCHIVNDTLIVDIICNHAPIYRYTRNCIEEEIVYGLTAQMVSEVIVKEYHILINNLFFK